MSLAVDDGVCADMFGLIEGDVMEGNGKGWNVISLSGYHKIE